MQKISAYRELNGPQFMIKYKKNPTNLSSYTTWILENNPVITPHINKQKKGILPPTFLKGFQSGFSKGTEQGLQLFCVLI